MANLTITVASVLHPANSPRLTLNIAGEALVRGQVVYLAADNKWYKAISSDTAIKAGNEEGSNKIRIVMADVSTGQLVPLLEPGQRYTVGATLTLGKLYVVSATSGLICLNTDLVTGNYFTPLGYPYSTTELDFEPNSTGQLTP